jgi:hypothetical protein
MRAIHVLIPFFTGIGEIVGEQDITRRGLGAYRETSQAGDRQYDDYEK